MKKIFLLLALYTVCLGYSQGSYEWGKKFEFDAAAELDPKFVLTDNYNTYLLTVVNTDGMLAKRQMIIRKFDQKNQLLDTYVYDFPKFDNNTLYQYLGSAEANGKVAVFTKTYSGKAKKYEIAKHEFDKTTAKFTTSPVESGGIASLSKSGDISLQKSLNGNYIAILNTKHREKKQPEKNSVIVLHAKTLSIAWQKEVDFGDEFTTKTFTVTNSGKAVLLRDLRSFKRSQSRNYLTVVSADGQEDKQFESQIFLQQPKAVSIGTQDYIIAFNSESTGLRPTEFSHILFYDLQQGRTLSNSKTTDFTSIKELKDVEIREIILQNNEIHIFAEAEVKAGTKPGPGMTGASFPVDVIHNGPSYLYKLSFEGTLLSSKKLFADTTLEGDLYSAFGLLNYKGAYYINTGNYRGIYLLDEVKNPKLDEVINVTVDDPFRNHGVIYINQLMHYLQESNRLILGRTIGDGEMALVTVSGTKL